MLWVEPEEVVDIEAWKAALVALNRRRDWLQERAPWLMVLAGPLTEGPQNLVNLCARHAPDFSSISISLLVRKEPLPKIRWLHLSDFHFTAESWERRRSAKALLEFLEGRKLPAIEILESRAAG